MSSLNFRLFGPYQAQHHGKPLPRPRTRTEQWLLALLVLRHDCEVERVWLAAQFWPDSQESQALYNLRRSLSDLRRVLGEEAYRLTSPTLQTVRLELSGVFADVVEFDRAMARGDAASLEQAVELYRGPLLEGCLAEWVLPERVRRAEDFLMALETLAERASARQEPAQATRYLRQVVACDPLRETSQQALLRALRDAGDSAGACAAYHDFRRHLHDAMQQTPDGETSALYQQIRRESRQRKNGNAAEPSSLSAAPYRLPRPLTPLVGREKELANVAKGLSATRLLTLVGTGGIGKTRLSIAAAEELADQYAEGIWFVELASLSTPDSVVRAVAAAFAVSEEPERSQLHALEDFLQNKSLLLILDNCEHLVEACARLAETLLGSSPNLHILATSRQSLGVRGERILCVPPLALPPLALLPDTDDAFVSRLMKSEAALLFTERARAVSASFQVTTENAAAVAQICGLLEGIPLALELAAAWTKALTVEQIAERLNCRLQLLTGGGSTVPLRQQTLRATLDWSHQLLSDAEQTLLHRLSVFAGGWTLEAAETICSDDLTATIGSENVLTLLARLIDKSLVVFEKREEQARYRLLETTREYAAEQGSAKARHDTAHRHAEYFLLLAMTAYEAAEKGADEATWRRRVGADQENLRAALVWWRHNDVEQGAKLALALWNYGSLSYHSEEARAWIECLQGESIAFSTTASALYRAAGEWAGWLGECEAARRLWEKALAMATACEDNAGIAATLLLLGADDAGRGDYGRAQARFENSLACFEALGDVRQASNARLRLARIACERGNEAEAQHLIAHCVEIGRQRGDQRIVFEALDEQAHQAFLSGAYDVARACLQEILQILRPARSFQTANALRALGAVVGAQGDYPLAWHYLRESLELHRECGFRPGMGWTFRDMAHVAWQQGDSVLAQDFLTQSVRLFDALGEKGSMEVCLQLRAQIEAASGDPARLRPRVLLLKK